MQIAVPSRSDVPEYQKLRSMVHEIVGRINGQFGTLTYVPIYHLDTRYGLMCRWCRMSHRCSWFAMLASRQKVHD